MKKLNNYIVGLLVLSMIGLCLPRVSYCAGADLSGKADQKKKTQHKPTIMSTAVKDIPLEKAEGMKKGTKRWLLIGLGVALVGGMVAAGGGGSSGDKSNEKGGITLNW